MKSWIYQDAKQVAKRGAAACSWYVGWYEPDGRRRCKSCGTGAKGRNIARDLADRLDAQLLIGTYESDKKQSWAEFRKEYQTNAIDAMEFRTAEQTRYALNQFERIAKPNKTAHLTTRTIDGFIAARRLDPGLKEGTRISPATINKELRHLRAALKKACKWGYLKQAPDFTFLREPGKLPTYMPPDDFAKIYHACTAAKRPAKHPAGAPTWWQALLVVTIYLTHQR